MIGTTHDEGHSGNSHNDEADRLAKLGSTLPLPPEQDVFLPCVEQDFAGIGLSPISLPKVSSDLPQEMPAMDKETLLPVQGALLPHRGRSKWRVMQEKNLQSLLEAQTEGQFWRIYKRLADPKSVVPLVSLSSLTKDFISRMNQLNPLPQTYNTAWLKLNTALNANIPMRTENVTPEKFFSHLFTEDDIEWAKGKIAKHSSSS